MVKKKWFNITGSLVLCGLFLISCHKNEVTTSQETLEEINNEEVNVMERLNEFGEYIPTAEQVKYLGRTMLLEDILWCSYSASGIEFKFSGTKCEITLLGDSSAGTEWGKGHIARVAIYVNDAKKVDVLMDEAVKTVTAYEGDLADATIRVVKLSESADSTLGIRGIKTDGNSIFPTEAGAMRIEFIGDSITCGYGVDGSLEDHYSTANENAAKTYAYLAAKEIGADYSLVCISGFGILSGYTGSGELNAQALLPKWYDKFGCSYGTILDEQNPGHIEWDFNAFQPDLVVINLGTNDYTYTGKDSQKGGRFEKKYVEFLKTVREKNPGATILCTLGILGNGLMPSVEEAVKQYSNETGDHNITTFEFAEQIQEDGYGVDWHPSAFTHEKAAKQLVAKIEELK